MQTPEARIKELIIELLGERWTGVELSSGCRLAEIGFDSLRLMALFSSLDSEGPLNLDAAMSRARPTTVQELIELCAELQPRGGHSREGPVDPDANEITS